MTFFCYFCPLDRTMENVIEQNLFIFAPLLKQTLWGGRRLAAYKQLAEAPDTVGESWEVSGIAGSESVVCAGAASGLTLTELMQAMGPDLVGRENHRTCGGTFPLLLKFIDARRDLSVQVHPNDELAMRRHGCCGKSEMWYVVDGAPGARLLSGFCREVSPDEYAARVAAGTLPDVLRTYDVHPGDVYYLPAGRVHSIGAGCLVCEVQQSCDITYRIYDYGRTDAEGRPRPLHVEEAREAIDFRVVNEQVHPTVVDNVPSTLVQTPYFTTSLYRLTEPIICDYSELDSFVCLVCTAGVCQVTCGTEQLRLAAGHTVLVAARADGLTLTPEGRADVLEVYV